jgi:hypothetical protein
MKIWTLLTKVDQKIKVFGSITKLHRSNAMTLNGKPIKETTLRRMLKDGYYEDSMYIVEHTEVLKSKHKNNN